MIIPTRLLFWADGFTVSQWMILIKPQHATNGALIAHERTHQEQMRSVGWLAFVWRYLSSRAFRQAMEVQAYRVQIACGASLGACAQSLARDYWLGIDVARARELLE